MLGFMYKQACGQFLPTGHETAQQINTASVAYSLPLFIDYDRACRINTGLYMIYPYTEDLMGLPVINIRHVPLTNTVNIMLKRCVDIIGSFPQPSVE